MQPDCPANAMRFKSRCHLLYESPAVDTDIRGVEWKQGEYLTSMSITWVVQSIIVL